MNERTTVVEDGDDRREPMDPPERGIPRVGRKKGPSRIWYIVIVGVMIVLVAALGSMAALNKLKNRGKGGAESRTDTVTSNPRNLAEDAFETTDEPPPLPSTVPLPTGQPGQPAQPGQSAGPPQLTPEQQAALDLAERRKRAPLVAVGTSGGGQVDAAASGRGFDPGVGNSSGTLGQALKATRTGAVSASMLADPNLMITQGRLLQCSLETAINSGVAGMTSCVLTRDIYSTNNRVLLLERGTRLVGQYQSGQLRRGSSRIFVLWTRAETPNGVLVNLDSPATGPLGRGGIDGKINRHFWERFGAALLVSVVDDVAKYQTAKAQAQNSGDTIQLGGTTESGKDAASIIVENSINIPPTLDKVQGSSVGVFVARDLFFGDVYSLQPTGMTQ